MGWDRVGRSIRFEEFGEVRLLDDIAGLPSVSREEHYQMSCLAEV